MQEDSAVNACTATAAIGVKRRCLEDEIAKLDKAVIALKSELSSLAPICTLPPEILGEVFRQYARSQNSRHDPDLGEYQVWPYAWIIVSHVCRHWRSVALGSPSLWSNVVVTYREDCVTEILRRSKRSLLDVTVDVSGTVTPASVTKCCCLALKELPRFRSLSVTAYTKLPDELLELLDKPAPNLRRLVLSTGSPCLSLARMGEQPWIPLSFGSEKTPRLERLELTRFNFVWRSFNLATLRHLKVAILNPQSQPSVVEFLNVMGEMPMLEILDLDQLIAPLPPGSIPSGSSERDSVVLPRLTFFRLLLHAQNCVHILNSLSLPALGKLHVEFDACRGVSELVPCVASLATKTSMIQAVRTLALSRSGLDSIIRCYDAEHEPPNCGRYSRAGVMDTFCAQFVLKEASCLLADVCQHLPFTAELQSLYLDEIWMETQTYLSLFLQCKAVTYLSAHGEIVDNTLLRALRRSDDWEDVSIDETSYPLPLLAKLQFSGVKFGVRVGYGDGHVGDFTSSLEDCLIKRYEDGFEIKELDLVRCVNLIRRDVEYIERVAATVKWDGVEEDDYEDDAYADVLWGVAFPDYDEDYMYDDGPDPLDFGDW